MGCGGWKKFALAIVSVLIALALAEWGASVFYPYFQPWTIAPEFRDRKACPFDTGVFDPHTGWWAPSNLDCVLPHEGGTIHLKTNSVGMRADREYGAKLSGVVRIGVFGDSVTFADQVQGNETYAAVIEQRVPNVEVLNFGLGGGGPDQSLLALRHKAAGFDLDAVIVAPLVENIVRTQMAERDGLKKPYFMLADGRLQVHNYPLIFQPPPPPTWRRAEGRQSGRPLIYDSALWQLTLTVMRPVTLTLGLYRPYTSYYGSAPGELLERILTAFRDEAPNAALIFVPLPTYHYIEYDLPRDYEPVFRRASEAVGGTYVDVLLAFKQLSPRERRATRFRFDQHYTALGHRVVGETLAPYVRALRDRLHAAPGS